MYVWSIFRLAKCDCNFALFYHNARYENLDALSFGVNYNSVAQKLRFLAIKAMFDPNNPFLTDSIDDRIKIKTEITSLKYEVLL